MKVFAAPRGQVLRIVSLAGCAFLIGTSVGAFVAQHVFGSLRYVGDGGTTFTPQPLAQLFAGVTAIGTFVGIEAASLAVASALALVVARRWRTSESGSDT